MLIYSSSYALYITFTSVITTSLPTSSYQNTLSLCIYTQHPPPHSQHLLFIDRHVNTPEWIVIILATSLKTTVQVFDGNILVSGQDVSFGLSRSWPVSWLRPGNHTVRMWEDYLLESDLRIWGTRTAQAPDALQTAGRCLVLMVINVLVTAVTGYHRGARPT